jgi:hypothetical protein
MWSAPVRAQAQIAAAWVLSRLAVTAAGCVVIVVCPRSMPPDDMSLLHVPAVILPGLVGVLIAMRVHARLLVRLIALSRRHGLADAAVHLQTTV